MSSWENFVDVKDSVDEVLEGSVIFSWRHKQIET
jgi:hypothetical protein